ncbi:MAG: hypothetical protein ABIO81_01890 [Ginsengibacter sp.]
MKKFFYLLSAVVALAACKEVVKGSNGVTYKTAVQYNDYIVSRQTILMKNIVAFGEMAQNNMDSAGYMLAAYVKETMSYINEIKGMPPYKGDSSLRHAAVNTFTFYKKVFENDYRQIIEINKSGEGATEKGSAKLNNIVADLTEEEGQLDKSFHNAQKFFAEINNMKLVENSMQKKVDNLK